MNIKIIIIGLLIVFFIQIILQIYAIVNLTNRKNFKYFNKNIWAVIIIFGNIFGTLFYIFFKGDD